MKKLIFTIALGTALSINAAAPIPVSWQILDNPVIPEGTLPYSAGGRAIMGDYNNDGILDFFMVSGQTGTSNTALYKGEPNQKFSLVDGTEIEKRCFSSALFVDIDNDGNLDLLVVGSPENDSEKKTGLVDLYRNTGAPSYNFVWDEEMTYNFPGVNSEGNYTKMLAAFDYNNDGWMDILVNGNAGSPWEVGGNGETRIVAIMKNDHGVLSYLENPLGKEGDFIPVNGGSVDVGDVNHDGYMDIVTTGYADTYKTMTTMYLNNQDGTFSQIADRTLFVGHQQGETTFIDINADGWLDIVEIGRDVNNSWANFAKLYINNKDNTYTKLDETATNLFGGACAMSLGDYNNDGKIDFFMAGYGTNATFVYNNGDNTFTTLAIDPDKARARDGGNICMDLNNDGLLDLHIFGYRDGGSDTPEDPTWVDDFVINQGAEGVTPNQAPAAPANVKAEWNAEKSCYVVTWDKPLDDTTPSDAIRYNLFVTGADGKTFYTVPADKTTGALKVVGTLPFLNKNSYDLKVPQGVYTIGVQAIDFGMKASAFALAGESSLATLLAANFDVFVQSNLLNISNRSVNDATVRVLAIDGRQVISSIDCQAGGSQQIQLAKGIYGVEITSNGTKTMVKAVVSK